VKGFRPRLVATFALVAALVSATLAVTSYLIVRRAVLVRATDVAVREAKAAVGEAVSRLPAGAAPAEVRRLVAAQPDVGDGQVLAIAADGSYDATSASLSPASVPPSLRSAVIGDRLAWVRTGSGRADHVVVGGRLPDGPRLYLFFPLRDEVADLEVLRNVLVGTGAALVLLSALVGLGATRGLLRPLRRARVATHRLEVGLLETRLPEEGDDEFTELARAFNRMADALQRTVGDLRALEASHRRFVSDVSHELRTPLTALTTAADVLEANTAGLNDPGRRAARLLAVESRRLAAMVEDLMEISRFDAGVPAMAWEPVDVRALVAGALDVRGWTERVEVEGTPTVTTWADPRRLDAVVGNLVGNALTHGRPPVRVRVDAGDRTVSVAVSDAGPGISADHLAHIFDRFYKADSSRSGGGGSGLGLAIARENARLHGGDVTVASDVGAGSRFTCTIPRRSAPPEEGAAGVAGAAPVAPPAPVDGPADATARQDRVVVSRRRGR
jgi:two-component system sensor histidine kinase MtrB